MGVLVLPICRINSTRWGNLGGGTRSKRGSHAKIGDRREGGKSTEGGDSGQDVSSKFGLESVQEWKNFLLGGSS